MSCSRRRSFRTSDEEFNISPKGEGVGLDAGIEKADLEGAIGDHAILPDKLIEPLPVYDTLAVGIVIGAMPVAGRFAVNRDTKPNGLAVCRAESRAWNR